MAGVVVPELVAEVVFFEEADQVFEVTEAAAFVSLASFGYAEFADV